MKAERLYEYLRKYRVLLIDVRHRDNYDQGHIHASATMCIEPFDLKPQISAEMLEERLVLLPENEQALFERRHEFDIVVYYDQNTSSTDFLNGPPGMEGAPALRNLYDSLFFFSYEKRLRDGRPPVLLLGGVDAWIDLMGPQSLATSKTATILGSTISRKPLRSGRPIARVASSTQNSNMEIRRRRLREYKPLNIDEKKEWLEQARNEEVEAPELSQASSDAEEEGEPITEEPASNLVHSYEDFLRRFPEPQAIQQSMVVSSRPPSHSQSDYGVLPQGPSGLSRPTPALARPSYRGETETRQAQAPLARQYSAARPPLYTSGSVSQRFKLPTTGLMNFGATCYMNATLQCLNATIPLARLFLDNRWRNSLQKNWRGSDGVMPEFFANLIRSLWKEDAYSIRPASFKNLSGRLNEAWRNPSKQQDAKEFFDFLIDCLHEDLNTNWQRSPLKQLTFKEEKVRESLPIQVVSKYEFDRYTHREKSPISNMFAGQHASRLRCKTCNNTSTTYEAFYSISVEIPVSGRGDIESCLRHYCQEEQLAGDELWKCPYCQCDREATKRILITRVPQTLVIHFKRFAASKTVSARKIHTPIEFPLHNLNIGDYVMPAPDAKVTRDLDKLYQDEGFQDAGVDPAITPPYLYDCYGVLRHLGDHMSSGHYIALVKDTARGVWRKFDDESYKDFDPNKLPSSQRLQNEDAYIVFYQRAPAR